MNFENEQKNKYEDYIKNASQVKPFERKQCLESSIHALIKTDNAQDQEKGYPFLGSVLQCMSVMYSEAIPTAGVMYNQKRKQFEMLINPYFFCRTMTHGERVAVLLHEMYHITFKHVFFDYAESTNKMQLNFAMDLVINQYIKGLPQMALSIDKFRTKDGKPFPPMKTTEYYYDLLNDAEMKNPNHDPNGKKCEKSEDGQPQPGEGQGAGPGSLMDPAKEWVDVQDMLKQKEAAQFDEHNWDENDADAKEKMEALGDLIKRTMVKSSYSHSTVPKHISDLLKEIEVQLKKLDYKAILMATLRKSLPTKDTRKTWTRPSRRYQELAPGNTVGLAPKIEVFIDTSGSMSHEEVNLSMKIMNNFLTAGANKCNVSFFHTDLYHTEKIKKDFKVSELAKKVASGGTDLTGVMDRIAKVKPDLSIVITDGYYGDVPHDPKKMPEMVFIISSGGTTEHPLKKFGSTVKYNT